MRNFIHVTRPDLQGGLGDQILALDLCFGVRRLIEEWQAGLSTSALSPIRSLTLIGGLGSGHITGYSELLFDQKEVEI